MNCNILNGGGYLFPTARFLGATPHQYIACNYIAWSDVVGSGWSNCACESHYSYNHLMNIILLIPLNAFHTKSDIITLSVQ